MHHPTRHLALRRLRWGAGSVAALSAGVIAAFVAGGASATPSPTLSVDQTAKVGGTAEAVAVTTGSRAVYWLSGETAHHLLCTSSTCLGIWIPVKAPAGKLTAAKGISGKLTAVARTAGGKRIKQLTLGGHLLYRFSPDTAGIAGGNGIQSFGGTWHVVTASGGASSMSTPSGATSTPSGTTSTPSTSTTTTTPTTYTYPPGYYATP